MALLLSFLMLLELFWDTSALGPLPSTKGSDGSEFELPTTNYETKDSYKAGPIGVLFKMVHVFLRVVQPNAFPEGKCPWREGWGGAVCLQKHSHGHTEYCLLIMIE